MSSEEKKTPIEKWRGDWTKVIQMKQTFSKSYSRESGGERTTTTITISIAKEFQDKAEEILKVVQEILKQSREVYR